MVRQSLWTNLDTIKIVYQLQKGETHQYMCRQICDSWSLFSAFHPQHQPAPLPAPETWPSPADSLSLTHGCTSAGRWPWVSRGSSALSPWSSTCCRPVGISVVGPHSTLLQEFQQRLLCGWRGCPGVPDSLVSMDTLWRTERYPEALLRLLCGMLTSKL